MELEGHHSCNSMSCKKLVGVKKLLLLAVRQTVGLQQYYSWKNLRANKSEFQKTAAVGGLANQLDLQWHHLWYGVHGKMPGCQESDAASGVRQSARFAVALFI